MKHTLEQAVTNRRKGNNQFVWGKDDIHDQFAIEWNKKIVEIRKNHDHTKLLNNSIEYVHQIYNAKKILVMEKVSISMISNSTELGIETLPEQWKNKVCDATVRLADKCVTNKQRSQLSNVFFPKTTIKMPIYINKQQLIRKISYDNDQHNRPNTRTISTFEQKVSVRNDQKDDIIIEIKNEMTNCILDSSNILLLNKFFETIHMKIMNLTNYQNDVVEYNDQLLKDIRQVIHQSVTDINNELAKFNLQLSLPLLADIHSPILFSLTILYYQKQDKDFRKSYDDLIKQKFNFCNYFLQLVENDHLE